jgi:lysophospholipase L1-like esterase
LGDSNIALGQYQADTSAMPNPMPNGLPRQGGMHSYKAGDPLFDADTPYGAAPHPLHNPPLHGIRQDSRYPLDYLPSTGNRVTSGAAAPDYFFYREESLFARMEYYLAEKGLYPTAFAPNQLGIYSAARSGAFTIHINDQIDAMLGAALPGLGPGSIGTNRSLDAVVVNLGTNDASVFGSADNTAIAAGAKNNLQNGIDRIISTFDPKVIIVNTVAMPLLINGSATGIPNTNQQNAASVISAKIVELDGYRDVVAVVNLATVLGTSGRQTGFADALHYNPIGYKIMAEKIVDKLHFIFATELPESSSFIYDVSDSNGKDKFKVKLNNVPVKVTGTLRRNDTVTKTNMQFLNLDRLSTSGQEPSGEFSEEQSYSTYKRFTFSEQRDFIEENLSTFTYKTSRVPYTKVDSVFDDNIFFAGTVRIVDTNQSSTVADSQKPGIFMFDVSTDVSVRAFSESTNDWSKVSVGNTAISNVVIKLIGAFAVGTVYEISDLGASTTTNAHWTAVNNNVSKTYAVGDIFKATDAGTAGPGIAKELGVEKDVSGSGAAGLEAGSKYTISDLGTGSNVQSNWNTAAGTTGVTYAVGSTFTATTAGAAISSGNGKAAKVVPAKDTKVTTLTVADVTDRNVVIETFENTQLVQTNTSVQASTISPLYKLPVVVNNDTYYILLQKE